MICKDQLTELHMKCGGAQEPYKSPMGLPEGHVQSNEKPLAALV